jgi:hypothetical protein
MLRVVKHFSPLNKNIIASSLYSFSSDHKSEFVPSVINQSKDFYSNIYGIAL